MKTISIVVGALSLIAAAALYPTEVRDRPPTTRTSDPHDITTRARPRRRAASPCVDSIYDITLSSRLPHRPSDYDYLWYEMPPQVTSRLPRYHMHLKPTNAQLSQGLLLCVESRNIGCVADFLDRGADIDAIIDAPANITAGSVATTTAVQSGPPLHAALTGLDWPMAAYLLSRNPQPQYKNAAGKTAVQVAGDHAPDCILQKLASRNFDIRYWPDAIVAFRYLAERHPNDAASAFNVAVSLRAQGQLKEAAIWDSEYHRRAHR